MARGIGRHTTNLLRHAPRHSERPVIGLVDPMLPPLPDSLQILFDSVRPNAQFLELHRAACLISPSPMTHDQLFVARLLHDPKPLKVAVVLDFIPYEQPQRYLVELGARLAYFVCLRWLARYDQFMAISETSADALRHLLGVPPARVMVTGVATNSVFGPASTPGIPSHVLVVGGSDQRKNVECPIRAHAACTVLQTARIPLVVTGSYGGDYSAKLRHVAGSAGGDPALVRMCGHVSDLELARLYRTSLCVVAPSRAEGFDVPVVEAMASGAPVLASDIPVHAELVWDAAYRFHPDDAPRLTQLLSTVMTNATWRTEAISAQAKVWPEFRDSTVATRFWGPITARLDEPALPAVIRRAKPRVALLTPLPPDHSGVADYSAATCAELGRLVDLHVFTETVRPPLPAGAASVRPISALPLLSARFDRVVNVVGNSHFHLRTFHLLLQYGGASICHDSRMLGFYRTLLGMDRTLAVASCELKRPVTTSEINAWTADESLLEALFYGEIAMAADPILVHSAVTAELVRARYGIAPVLLPFCIYRPWQAEQLERKGAARKRLGLPENQVVVATFGFVHKTKAPEECIWAIHMLRDWDIDAVFCFVGTSHDAHELKRLVSTLGLRDNVRFLGDFVSEDIYRDYLVAADLGIQLRTTYLGSLSGGLLDCIAAGLPTVTNASLAESVNAPSYVRRVPDRLSPILIAEALADLLSSGLCHTRPELERQGYVAAHSFAIYAEKLCHALGLDAVRA